MRDENFTMSFRAAKDHFPLAFSIARASRAAINPARFLRAPTITPMHPHPFAKALLHRDRTLAKIEKASRSPSNGALIENTQRGIHGQGTHRVENLHLDVHPKWQ